MLSKKNVVLAILVVFVGTFVMLNANDIFTKEAIDKLLYTGKEDHAITLEEASAMTANFRAQAGPDQVIGGYFGRDAVERILSQDGTVGFRYYYGLDEEGTPHIILVGVDKNGQDMTDGFLAERSFLCPPLCSDENELNSSQNVIELASK